MQTLTRELIALGWADRVLTDAQMSRVLAGSPQRRYHLVNRAMSAGELLRLRRGRYVLGKEFRDHPAHPFALAQAFDAGSYVSLESALAYHRWIPEAVQVVASITLGRKSSHYEHSTFGSFSFHPLALAPGYFLALVERLKLDGQTALMAHPARALMDLVCLRKQMWQGLAWLVDSLRIDEEQLRGITGADIRTLRLVYRHQRVQSFLSGLARELGND
ncbi:MAG: hypothetical protein ABIO49_00315 [Dokdonella sp.]